MHRRSWYSGLGDVETARKMGFASVAMAFCTLDMTSGVQVLGRLEQVCENGSYGPYDASLNRQNNKTTRSGSLLFAFPLGN